MPDRVLGILSSGGTRYELESERIYIGRSSECEIVIDAKGISRRHALLELGGNGGVGFITDLDSVNGTFLNGQRLKPREPVALRNGDVLVFSAYEKKEYRFESKSDVQMVESAVEESKQECSKGEWMHDGVTGLGGGRARFSSYSPPRHRPTSPDHLPPAGLSSSLMVERKKPIRKAPPSSCAPHMVVCQPCPSSPNRHGYHNSSPRLSLSTAMHTGTRNFVRPCQGALARARSAKEIRKRLAVSPPLSPLKYVATEEAGVGEGEDGKELSVMKRGERGRVGLSASALHFSGNSQNMSSSANVGNWPVDGFVDPVINFEDLAAEPLCKQTSTEDAPAMLSLMKELEQIMKLEIRPLPVLKRKHRLLNAIRTAVHASESKQGLMSAAAELADQRKAAGSLIAGIMSGEGLPRERGVMDELLESDEEDEQRPCHPPLFASGSMARIVAFLEKTQIALSEAERRERTAARKWHSLQTELKAKNAELRVYKENARQIQEPGNLNSLRARLQQELSHDQHRRSAAEIVVSALEETEKQKSAIEKDFLRVRAKLASAVEKLQGGRAAADESAIDRRLELEKNGSLEEVVRLKGIIAELAAGIKEHAPDGIYQGVGRVAVDKRLGEERSAGSAPVSSLVSGVQSSGYATPLPRLQSADCISREGGVREGQSRQGGFVGFPPKAPRGLELGKIDELRSSVEREGACESDGMKGGYAPSEARTPQMRHWNGVDYLDSIDREFTEEMERDSMVPGLEADEDAAARV